MKRLAILVTAAVLFSISVLEVTAQSGGAYTLNWFSVAGGSGNSSGGSHVVLATIGQPDAGAMSGGQFTLAGGFQSAGLTVNNTATPTRTGTSTKTSTATPTRTGTVTKTSTATLTRTLTATKTFTATPTRTLISTQTVTATPTRTLTRTLTPTRTFTPTPTRTNVGTKTSTPTNTATRTMTLTPSATPSGCSGRPSKPTLAKPPDKAVKTELRVTLKWRFALCAQTFTVIVKDTTTNKTVDSEKHLTVLKYKTIALSQGKSYRWFVKACDSAGCTRSVKRTFSIQ